MKKLFVLICLSLSLVGMMYAQEGGYAQADTLSSRIYFRTGSAKLDTAYAGNAATLRAFVADVNALMKDPEVILHSILVETGASPEGGVEYNERLAMDRARSVRSWLLANLPLNASQVKAYSVGADWEGLWREVWDSDCPWRKEILDVITETGVRNAPSDEAKRLCQQRLKAIDGGKAWAWMMENLFPTLRAGAGTLHCLVSRPGMDRVRDTLVVIHEYEGPDADWYLGLAALRATDAATANVKEAFRKKPKGFRRDSLWLDPVFALRMNMLMPAMNVGMEIPVGNHWSIAADWYFPWVWRQWGNRVYEPQKYCFEGLGGYLEGRYWFGNNHLRGRECRKYRLSGHSLGLIVAGGYYDLQWDWKGRQGEYGAVGIGYMYGLPLGKKGGVHLEFEIAFGYMTTVYRGYEVHETGGRLIGDWKDGSWKGPVPLKAGFNLVVPFFDRGIIKPAK